MTHRRDWSEAEEREYQIGLAESERMEAEAERYFQDEEYRRAFKRYDRIAAPFFFGGCTLYTAVYVSVAIFTELPEWLLLVLTLPAVLTFAPTAIVVIGVVAAAVIYPIRGLVFLVKWLKAVSGIGQ